MSSAPLTSKERSVTPSAGAADYNFFNSSKFVGLTGFHNTATWDIEGSAVLRSSSRLVTRSKLKSDNPVTFPPGRARLATRPVPTGSPAFPMTTGMVLVALFAARAAGVPSVTSTSVLRRTSSAASLGRSSNLPAAYRWSMTMFWPSEYPSSRSPCRNAARRLSSRSAEDDARKPIRRTCFACCASTASGAARRSTATALASFKIDGVMIPL